MSTISITKLYDLLSVKVGKEAAENLTTFIEEKIKNEVTGKIQNLAGKVLLTEELRNTKAEIIKWMFIFWVGQVVVTFGFILLFLNK